MSVTEQLKMIEQNHLDHFVFLPQKLGFDIQKINGVTVIHGGFGSSMFNIAYGGPEKDFDTLDAIQKVKKTFNSEPFAWWIPQSQYNPKFTEVLLKNGFTIETIEHAMVCTLATLDATRQKTDLQVKSVASEVELQDFIEVLEPYDALVRSFYERVTREQLQLQEKLFVGYAAGKPATIGILFISGISAGIFSLLTNDEMRGQGYGTDMMRFLIKTAKAIGCQFVTLSVSSDSGYRIYERLGFRKISEFECFEFKGDEKENKS